MNTPRIDVVYERQWSSLNNLIAALSKMGCMGRLFGGFPKFRYVRAGIPEDVVKTFPVASLWNFAARRAKLPVSCLLDEPRWVGTWVARQRDLAPIVLANGTAHRFLFPKLKGTGRTLILERGSMHPEDFFHFPQRARREAGYPHATELPPALVDEIAKNQLVDYLIAGSEMVRQSYVTRGFPAECAFTCRYGVNAERFAFIERDPPAGRPVRIAAIGLIGFRKGFFRLLKIGEWAAKRGFSVEIHFAGPVEDEEVHEMLAKTTATCVLHGVVKGEAMTRFLAAADLCATLSYEEGLPIALLEAMSTGLPAVVSTDTGAREVVGEGVEGCQLTDFSEEEFDAKLAPLLEDPARLPIMGKKAAATIRNDYTSEAYGRRLVAALTRIQELEKQAS